MTLNEQLEHELTLLDRRSMADFITNVLFADVEPHRRAEAALAWATLISELRPVDCWAGHCIHYVDGTGHIVSAILVRECPCGARSARSVGELPKRPFPRKGKR